MKKNCRGRIEVICGSMFSGKTEELIRRLKRAKIAKQKIEVFKPKIDNRYDKKEVVSHDKNIFSSTSINSITALAKKKLMSDVIAIDEAQFFDDQLIKVSRDLANQGKRVIIAGLDMDYEGNPFGPMPKIMAIAEQVTKVHAICVDCGDLANFSSRIPADGTLILVGEKEAYKPLCRTCFNKAV